MNAIKPFITLLFILIASSPAAQNTEEAAQAKKISLKLVSFYKKLTPSISSTNTNWAENKEVSEIKSWPTLKRMAAIRNIIWELQENEKKLLPNFENDTNQLAAGLISRIFSYNYLKGLILDSTDEIGTKDYLNGEISDLNLTLNHKLPYGMYASERKRREDKLNYLYMSNKEFVEELLKLKLEKNSAPSILSSKTSAISLMETCVNNLDICEKL